MQRDPTPRFYGRRYGRRLRSGRERLMRELLPRLRIPDDTSPVDPAALFGTDIRDCWLEIGFGAGEHLAAQASRHPETGFIGCEPFVNGVARLLAAIADRGLENIRIFPDDARLLLGRLPSASIGRAFVLFPDPWPKKRHALRRLIGPRVLDDLARIMRDDAELRVASDEMGYVRWSLMHLQRHPDFRWLARTAGDWRERPADWPPTRYEEKAVEVGRRPAYLAFRRRARDRQDAGKS